jgi:hypothetical protein
VQRAAHRQAEHLAAFEIDRDDLAAIARDPQILQDGAARQVGRSPAPTMATLRGAKKAERSRATPAQPSKRMTTGTWSEVRSQLRTGLSTSALARPPTSGGVSQI